MIKRQIQIQKDWIKQLEEKQKLSDKLKDEALSYWWKITIKQNKLRLFNLELDEIFNAVRDGNLQYLKDYVNAGGDINVKDENGYTLGHTAAHFGQLNCLKYYVEQGGDINAITNSGWTIGHHAAFSNHYGWTIGHHADCLHYYKELTDKDKK